MDDLNQGPPTGWTDGDSSPHWAGKLAVPSAHGLVLIAHERIVRLEADGSYTLLHLCDAKPMLVSRNLKEVHADLPQHKFFRCHHKHAVNMTLVAEVEMVDGARLIMANGDVVRVSRRKWAQVKEAIRRM